ncbi:importin-13 [Fopius arisanus]|uniref:Importin-13 n=1 Tax=Fopius arisanus TaxID=64838 RepID=A0A0C9R537_9HYME|nr:PREDICTED: importin-13 [Fopius arisanus]
MDYSAAVEDAVRRFYSTGANDAHLWLLQFQASHEAWTHIWPLLEPSRSCEVQFFAATTLHAKISKQWNEVPPSDYSDLRNRILTLMKNSTTSKLVLARLCQALAAFLASSDGLEGKNESEGMIDDLIRMFPYDNQSSLDLLLRVLIALPREFEKKCGLKRPKLRDNLVASWCKTSWLLRQVFTTYEGTPPQSSDDSLYLLSIECALAWLKVGPLPVDSLVDLYPHLVIAASNYVPTTEDAIEDARGWELVQECLILAIAHSDLPKRPQLLWEWCRGLVSVAEQKGGIHFSELLTSLGDIHSRFILLSLTEDADESHRWTSETLIKLLLECSELPGRYPIEERKSCIPFGFWFSFQDNVTTFDPPVEDRARNALKPIYARLAQALLRKATLPSCPDEAGDADERELLRCYRQDAADTFTYCYNILGYELLILLGRRLTQPQDNQKWTDVESSLHAFQALCDSVGTQETEYVPALIDIVLSHIPYQNYPKEVLASACSTIGAYAEWIGENPDPWLERSLQLVTLGLTQGSVASTPASMALKDISREGGPHLAPLAPSILETISRTLPVVPPGGGEGLRLMYAAGKLLNSLSSTEEQLKYLDATLGLCVMRLQVFLRHPINTGRVAVANQLKMITMFLSTLEGAIGKSVLDGLVPIFEQIVAHSEWGHDDVILEAMHTCAQKSLQCLLHPETEATPLLLILVNSYKVKPHPAALGLLRQMVLLCGSDIKCGIGTIFGEISGYSLRGFKACETSGGDLSELSDLLEAYLGLLAQVCKKTPMLMLHVPDQVPDMLRCGITGLGLPEYGVTKAAGTFLAHAVKSRHLNSFVSMVGQELVCMILHSVGGRIPKSNLESHARVLLSLNDSFGEYTGQWLRLAVADSTALTTPGQKEDFTRNVLRERNSKRLFETLLKFSLQCQKPVIGL